MQPLDAPAKLWGNPAAKDFRKKHIRVVTHNDTTTLVNIKLVDQVANLIADATGPLPETLIGWTKPQTSEHGPEHYGIAIEAHPNLPEAHGFTRTGDLLVYSPPATPAATTESYEKANTEPVLGQVQREARDGTERWATKLPAEREAGEGDAGNDVMAFQLIFNTPEQSGVMTARDAAIVRMLQQRWGIEVTGTLTRKTWICILPRLSSHYASFGDSGYMIKVLQALLVAYDWDAGQIDMNGYYDRATTVAVNNLQTRYGLRRAPKVAAPEWAALIGQWPLT